MRFDLYYNRICFGLHRAGRHQGPKVPVWGAVNLLGPKLLRNADQVSSAIPLSRVRDIKNVTLMPFDHYSMEGIQI